EGLSGSANVDHRGDIYGIGGMLYQMLTGKTPHGRFEPPSVAVPGLDKRFDAIVDKAMHADAAKRFSSAGELQAELARIAAAQPQAANEGTGNPTGPSRRRSPKPLLAMLLVTATIFIAVFAFDAWKKNRRGPTPAVNAQPDPKVAKIADISDSKPASTARWHD